MFVVQLAELKEINCCFVERAWYKLIYTKFPSNLVLTVQVLRSRLHSTTCTGSSIMAYHIINVDVGDYITLKWRTFLCYFVTSTWHQLDLGGCPFVMYCLQKGLCHLMLTQGVAERSGLLSEGAGYTCSRRGADRGGVACQ